MGPFVITVVVQNLACSCSISVSSDNSTCQFGLWANRRLTKPRWNISFTKKKLEFIIKMRLFSCMPLYLFLISWIAVVLHTQTAAKEVEASHEWTRLGENDTVDAGMHIRIDMSTGEKWVKLPDSNDKENAPDASVGQAEISMQAGVVVSHSAEDDHETTNLDDSLDYDYDMMHRTLSQLPDHEKKQILLPDSVPNAKTASHEERKLFERRMRDIWVRRQEELRQVQQQYVADIPEILKERIKSIQSYLLDPIPHLLSMNLEEDDPKGVVTHVVSALQDLEYTLSDVDMARDFFTMGGWTLLLSMVSDESHLSPNVTLSDELMDKMHSVQMHAAWALGTSVKNIEEFAPYATVSVPLIVGSGHVRSTTAIDLLLEQYLKPRNKGSSMVRSLRDLKLLYALGALLRGNREAQIRFASSEGPSALGLQLETAVDQRTLSKLAQRIMSLADDIVTDVKSNPSQSPHNDKKIIAGFTTERWCNAVLAAIRQHDVALQEKALQTLQALIGTCTWAGASLKQVLEELRTRWHDTAANRNRDFHSELVGMIDQTINIIEDADLLA